MCSSQALGAGVRRARERGAFTLVELLVVIAIIGAVVSLLLPAVQYAREAARRTRCQNNLRQMVIGLHNFAGCQGYFPSAYEAVGTLPGWGWGSAILPFVEQQSRFDAAQVATTQFGAGANPALPTPHTKARLPLYRCPSDPAPDLNTMRLEHGLSNYRAVAGPNDLGTFVVDLDYGGAMYQNSRMRLARITDGTSNTLIVGECLFDEKTGKRAALWSGMTGLRALPGDSGASMWVSDVMWSVDDANSSVNGPAPQAFSSRHVGGAFFAFCDGSVRFFSSVGDKALVKWLAGRDDGNVVPAP
jgi:prepilin-type N-terminal cleavage/methylation domain-containing protein/prepilin-type processing-associated H-X9-DG protein